MFRVWLIPVVALIGLVIPSVTQAQTYVVPLCNGVNSQNSYGAPLPCIPTGVPTWLRPTPVPPPPVVPVYPAPVYAAPVYVAPVPPSRGLDPWIPLAVRPTPSASPMDFTTQMLLLQQLAAARQYRAQRAAAPTVMVPAPVPPPAAGEGWMSGFIKGVK